MVTVACSASSSSAAGLPTTVDRPTTTARRPLSGTRSCRRIGQHRGGGGRGEHAREPGGQPAEGGRVRAVDVLADGDRGGHGRDGSTPGGSGVWQMTPCTAGSRASSVRRSRDLLRAGRCGLRAAHLVYLAGDAGPGRGPLDGPHVPGRARVVGGDQHRQGPGRSRRCAARRPPRRSPWPSSRRSSCRPRGGSPCVSRSDEQK